jgi:uncharacterized membrane protein YbhN (UPF0104 family)
VVTKRLKHRWQILFNLLLVVAFIYVLLSQYDKFTAGWHVLNHAAVNYVCLAGGLTVVTFLLAAAVYRLLVLRPVAYKTLLGIELAAAFANRLLPSGIGGLGVHGIFLHHRRHTTAQATAVVSTNNLIGMLGHVILLAIILLLAPTQVFASQLHIDGFRVIGGICILLAVAIGLTLVRPVKNFFRNLFASFKQYLKQPTLLFTALVVAMALTLTYVGILYASAHAVGINLAFGTVFVVFSIGVLLGTASPTPGGLIGVEAGMFTGFVAYNAASGPALASIVLYRLFTYLLPILPGALAFWLARRQKLL